MKITAGLCIVSLFFTLNLSVSFAAPVGKMLPVNLQCELRISTLGVDVSNPDLSDILKAANPMERGLYQTAYQVLVATSPALLKNNNGNL